MANHTQNLILETFANMLEQMPFEKITVTALIRECNIGRNTFYYHYEDIYALLDDTLSRSIGKYENAVQNEDWKSVMKDLLYFCRDNRNKVYHIYNSLSRDRLAHYAFARTDKAIAAYIKNLTEAGNVDPGRIETAAEVVRYSIYGYFLRFLWNDMKDDIEESVDQFGCFMDEMLDKMLI